MTDHEPLLQRLVDGELPAEVRHALLQEAETQPKLWREIALAFIESEILKDEIGALFESEEPSSETAEDPTVQEPTHPHRLATASSKRAKRCADN